MMPDGTISPREERQMTTQERIAAALIGLGVIGITTGAGVEWGWPVALMVASVFLIAGGIFAGLVGDDAK